MLSERFKQFIESVATDLQATLSLGAPQEYNATVIVNFFKGNGNFDVKFIEENEMKNQAYIKGNIIYMNCTERELVESTDDNQETNIRNRYFLKIFFHEIWHYLSQQFSQLCPDDIEPQMYAESFPLSISEMSANYFSRAMLMPKNLFTEKVAQNTNSDGICNVFSVARYFKVEYTDVIARGKDLNLWNMKVGI